MYILFRARPQAQSGAILLESLLAILIFSLGLLGLMGLQASSIQRVSQSKYRFDAAFLANQLSGTIWTATTQANGNASLIGTAVDGFACEAPCIDGGSNTELTRWLDQVGRTLPGVRLEAGDTQNAPDIVVTSSSSVGRQVTITLRWQSTDNRGGSPISGVYQTTSYFN